MIWKIDLLNTEEEKNKFSIFIYKEKTKMAKLKKLVKETIKGNQNTLYLAIYNSSNQRSYITVKIK